MTSPAEHAATVRYEDALKALAAGHLSYDRWVPVALAERADELERERDEALNLLEGVTVVAEGWKGDAGAAEARAEQLETALRALGWDVGQSQICWCDERRFDRDLATGAYDYDFANPEDHPAGCIAARAVLDGGTATPEGEA